MTELLTTREEYQEETKFAKVLAFVNGEGRRILGEYNTPILEVLEEWEQRRYDCTLPYYRYLLAGLKAFLQKNYEGILKEGPFSSIYERNMPSIFLRRGYLELTMKSPTDHLEKETVMKFADFNCGMEDLLKLIIIDNTQLDRIVDIVKEKAEKAFTAGNSDEHRSKHDAYIQLHTLTFLKILESTLRGLKYYIRTIYALQCFCDKDFYYHMGINREVFKYLDIDIGVFDQLGLNHNAIFYGSGSDFTYFLFKWIRNKDIEFDELQGLIDIMNAMVKIIILLDNKNVLINNIKNKFPVLNLFNSRDDLENCISSIQSLEENIQELKNTCFSLFMNKVQPYFYEQISKYRSSMMYHLSSDDNGIAVFLRDPHGNTGYVPWQGKWLDDNVILFLDALIEFEGVSVDGWQLNSPELDIGLLDMLRSLWGGINVDLIINRRYPIPVTNIRKNRGHRLSAGDCNLMELAIYRPDGPAWGE